MDIINNRFRVIRKIEKDYAKIEAYEVLDLWDEDYLRNLKIIDINNLDPELSLFLKEWLLSISRFSSPFFSSVLLLDTLDFKNSTPMEKGRIILVSETKDYLSSDLEYVVQEEVDLESVLIAGNLFSERAGLGISFIEEDVDIINDNGNNYYRFKDLFTIKINNLLREQKREKKETIAISNAIKEKPYYRKLMDTFKGYGEKLSEYRKESLDLFPYIKEIEDYLAKKDLIKVVGIKGTTDSGKSELLSLIRIRELLEGKAIFSDFVLGKLGHEKHWKNLIYRFFSSTDEKRGSLVSEDNLNFSTELKSAKKLGGHGRLQNKINDIKIILETLMFYVTDKQILLIVDNIHLMEDMVLELLFFLIVKFQKNKEISLLFSYNQEEGEKYPAFIDFRSRLRELNLLNEVQMETNWRSKERETKVISEEEKQILKIISLFKESIPAEYIEEISSIRNSRRIVGILVNKGILELVPVTGRVAFAFKTSKEKDEVINSLTKEDIQKISDIAIKILKEREPENYQEILHLIEISEKWEEKRIYSMEMAKKMKESLNIEMSIYFYLIALKEYKDPSQCLVIYSNLAEAFYILGKYDKLEKLLIEVERVFRETGSKEYGILYYDISLQIAQIDDSIENIGRILEEFQVYVENVGDNIDKIVFLRRKAQFCFLKGEYEEAEKFLKEVIEKSDGIERLNNVKSYAYRELGIVSIFKPQEGINYNDKMIKATYIFEKGRRFSRKIGDIDGEIKSMNNIANINMYYGKYKLAVKEYTKSLELSRRVGLIDNQIVILNNIASLENNTGEFESAYKNSHLALELSKTLGIDKNISFILTTIANIANNMNHIDQCCEYINTLAGLIKLGRYKKHEFLDHYKMHTRFLMRIGDYNGIRTINEDLYKLSPEEIEEDRLFFIMIKLMEDIVLDNNFCGMEEVSKEIRKLESVDSYEFKDKVSLILECTYYLLKKVAIDKVQDLVDACLSLKGRIFEIVDNSRQTSFMAASIIHIDYLNGNGDEKIVSQAINYARGSKYQLLKIDLLTHNAEIYMAGKDYEYGFSNLLEVAFYIQFIMDGISEKKKLKFFNSMGFAYPLMLLESILEGEERPERIQNLKREEMNRLLEKEYTKNIDLELLKKNVWKSHKRLSKEVFKVIFVEKEPYLYFNNNAEKSLICLKYFADNSLAKNATVYYFNEAGDIVEHVRLYDLSKDYFEEDLKVYIMEWKRKPKYKKIDIRVEGAIGTNSLVFQPLFEESQFSEKKLLGVLVLEFDRNYNYSHNRYFSNMKKQLGLLSLTLLTEITREESRKDKLTGLLTRKVFEDEVNSLLKGGTSPVYFLMFDIDKFKRVNDTFGHRFGDTVLKTVSEKLASLIEGDEILGRIGGEEFMLVVPGDKKDIVNYAENLRMAVSLIDYEQFGKPDLTTTISIGISKFPDDGTTYKTLVENADRAMYKSKADGRNRVSIYELGLAQKGKAMDELAGIIGDNEIINSRNIRTIVETIFISLGERVKNLDMLLLKKLKNLMGASLVALIQVEGDRIDVLSQIRDSDFLKINKDLVKRLVKTQESFALIDWSRLMSINRLTGVPEWHSVMLLPVKYNSKCNKIIYISTNYKEREYDRLDINLSETIINILAKEIYM